MSLRTPRNLSPRTCPFARPLAGSEDAYGSGQERDEMREETGKYDTVSPISHVAMYGRVFEEGAFDRSSHEILALRL